MCVISDHKRKIDHDYVDDFFNHLLRWAFRDKSAGTEDRPHG